VAKNNNHIMLRLVCRNCT